MEIRNKPSFQIACAIPVVQQVIGVGEIIFSALGAIKDLGKFFVCKGDGKTLESLKNRVKIFAEGVVHFIPVAGTIYAVIQYKKLTHVPPQGGESVDGAGGEGASEGLVASNPLQPQPGQSSDNPQV